jgi:S-DNA-T family DNA segregation ATPase FtsK/SpoIIIE
MSESDPFPKPPASPTYEDAKAVALHWRKGSTSLVQRKLYVGYNLAASWIERMEADGVVSRPDSSGFRAVLAPTLPPEPS